MGKGDDSRAKGGNGNEEKSLLSFTIDSGGRPNVLMIRTSWSQFFCFSSTDKTPVRNQQMPVKSSTRVHPIAHKSIGEDDGSSINTSGAR